MTDVKVETTQTCGKCGHELKTSALFCTSCGERRDEETQGQASGAGDAATACGACGAKLKAGAEFCTNCGVSIEEKASDPSGETPKERISPAASRAILGSVSGGMGSYVGKSTAPAGGATPPKTAAAIAQEESRRRRILIGVIAAVVVGILGGIGLIIAMQSNGDASLKAGGSRAKGSVEFDGGGSDSSASDTSTGKSSSKGSPSKSKGGTAAGSKGHGTGTSSKGSSPSSTSGAGSSSSHASGSGSSKGTSTGSSTSSGSSGHSASGSGGGSSGGGGGGSHPVVTAPPRASFTQSVTVRPGTVSFQIANSGGGKVYWSIFGASMQNDSGLSASDYSRFTGQVRAAVPATPGGRLSFSNTSGSISAHSSTTVTITWSDGIEGQASGSFRVRANGAVTTVSVSGDSRQADTPRYARSVSCTSNCGYSDNIFMYVDLNAAPGFMPAPLANLSWDGCGNVCNVTVGDMKPSGSGFVQLSVQTDAHVLFQPGQTQLHVYAPDKSGVSGDAVVKIFAPT